MSITTRAPYGFELEYMPIDAFGGAGPHKLNPIAYSLMHKQPTLHGGGGGNVFKAVVAVAAAVAVPYFAPQIAASIGLSGAVSSALAGTALAGASGAIAGGIVGAALGAVTAKVTGQDAGRGALFGAIGGGITGYQGINSATGALNAPTTTAIAGSQAPVTTGGGVGGLTPGMSQAEMLAAQEAGFGMTQQAQMLAAQDAGLGATLSSGGAETAYGYQAPTAGLSTGTAPPQVAGSQGQVQTGAQPGMTQQQAMLAEQQAGFDVPPPTTQSQQAQMLAAQDAAFGTTPGATAVGYTAPTQTTMGAIGEKLTTAATNVGKEVVKSISDPKKQADLLLRAAGQIAGTYLAPEGMTPEQKAELDKQRQELETLRTTNQELFKEKLNAARQLVQDANYFDPEYFGLQRARQVQQAGAKVEREQLAKIPQTKAGLRASEQRRIRLGTGRDVGTAYDTGFTTAVDAQNRARSAGLNLYPSASSLSTQTYAQNLMGMYDKAEERKRDAIARTQKLFGTVLG